MPSMNVSASFDLQMFTVKTIQTLVQKQFKGEDLVDGFKVA